MSSAPWSIYRSPDGKVEEGLSLPRLIEVAQSGEGELWVDIDALDKSQHALLEKVFHFHPLSIEDTLSPKTRVKLEEYPRGLFIVVRSVSFEHRTEDPYDINTINLYCFLVPHVLVTVRSGTVCAVDEMKSRIARTSDKLDRGIEMILHGLLDIIVDEYIPLVDQVDDMVDKLEERLFENYDETSIKDIFAIKRLVVQLRRHLSPLREVLNLITNRPQACITPQSQLYFRDVYDHTIRIVESLESVRDLSSSVLDTYLTQTSNRMNRVMKQLNVVATISLPLVVIGGIFGMNFSWMPMTHSPWGFFGALGIMVISALLIWLFLKKREWV